ncbi:MAG TPA: ABC transporter permease [Mobilitalea sp.]|nr:ABC transporter permease [Mobilitalea sp.]
MGNVMNNFKKYQFLLVELVKKNIKLKYRRSYLGIVWTLLEPILTTIVLTFVFSEISGKSARDPLFAVYVLTGRLLYSFFANATKSAMKSIRGNSAMIKKVYVPKYIYPLSSVLSGYVTFLISMIVLFGAIMIFKITPTFHMFSAIIPLVMILILSLGIGLILSTLAVFFRDLEYLWSVMLMLIMYTSAIFYKIENVGLDKSWIFNINPVYPIIVNFRNAIFGRTISIDALMLSVLYSFGSLLIGVVLFYKKQDKFILNI